jgi:uncharacterized membrane protein YczE
LINTIVLRRSSPIVAWLRLLTGLTLFALGIVLMVRSNLGLGPWDMLHQGIFVQTGLSFGKAGIVVGLAIFVVLWPFGLRPGLGSVANMLLIGVVTDLVLPHLPIATSVFWGLGYHLSGIAMTGFGTGLYVSAHMGAGPRDSLMLILTQRTGWPVRRVRTLIEVVVLLLGWLMGGTLGLGTVLFAVLIGAVVQWSLHVCDPHGSAQHTGAQQGAASNDS